MRGCSLTPSPYVHLMWLVALPPFPCGTREGGNCLGWAGTWPGMWGHSCVRAFVWARVYKQEEAMYKVSGSGTVRPL